MPRLLVVEDDATLRSSLVQTLTTAGYAVEQAENGLQALEKASNQSFDLIVSDIRMPGMDGVVTISRLKQTLPRIKTILITGYPDEAPIMRAVNLGVDGILRKPFAQKEFLCMVSLKLEEKHREDLQGRREGKYRRLLSKMRENLGEEKIREILGEDFSWSLDAPLHETAQLALLVELGRMAEMRLEFDVAIQAYEQGLTCLSGSIRKDEEFPIRLALSNLLEKTGEAQLALFHGREALKLAEQLGEAECLIEANHHLGKILLESDQDKSWQHLTEAQLQLEITPHEKGRAVSSFLFCAFWRRKGELEKAEAAIADFLSFGKRHFLPQILISLQDVGLSPFLLSLQERLHGEEAAWVLEEAGPFIQDGLRNALKMNPSLSALLTPFLFGNRETRKSALEIFGFGKLIIFIEGRPLLESHWRSMKGRSLFMFLVHEYPKLVSEDHLLDTFWPLLDGEKGRHAFRTTLYFIRRTLGTAFCREFLFAEKQKYGIRPGSKFACDFLRFRDSYAKARAHWEKGDREHREHAALLLKEAEALYKGDFLQGSSEEWVLAARERFREALTWIFMGLATYHRKEKSWNEALLYAKQAVEMDPTLEEAHSFSMECFLEIGKRDEAVRQFHACKEILKSELKLSPSESVRELYLRAIDTRPMAGARS